MDYRIHRHKEQIPVANLAMEADEPDELQTSPLFQITGRVEDGEFCFPQGQGGKDAGIIGMDDRLQQAARYCVEGSGDVTPELCRFQTINAGGYGNTEGRPGESAGDGEQDPAEPEASAGTPVTHGRDNAP